MRLQETLRVLVAGAALTMTSCDTVTYQTCSEIRGKIQKLEGLNCPKSDFPVRPEFEYGDLCRLDKRQQMEELEAALKQKECE